MHTGSASRGLPNIGANASIKRLLMSINETASRSWGAKNIKEHYYLIKHSVYKLKVNPR